MKIALTGGTGCLGNPLLEKLIDMNFSIKLLTLPGETLTPDIDKKVETVTGDINTAKALDLLTKNCQILFHLAGKVHSIPKNELEEKDFYKINVEGTKNILKSANSNNVKRVVFYSTVGVYGKDADFHGNELSPCNPVTAYAKSKLLAEKLVLESSKNGGPEGVVLRFPVVYGPLDKGNVAKMIKAIHKKLFFYFGTGNYMRSMISSKNATEAAIKAAFEPKAAKEIFLVTDGQDYSLKEFANTICESLEIKWRPFQIPLPIAKVAGQIGDLIERITRFNFPINSERVSKLSNSLTFSCDKAKNVINYKPVETLSDGIKDEVNWLKAEKGWG